MPSSRVIVVGAGFGGLGTAIALRRAGFTDVTVLEKADRVGGVWQANTYPDAACDVPSALYSWSFAPNPHWSDRYSRQPEIRDYIERTARREGVLDLVRFGVEVTEAAWSEASATWELLLVSGERLVCDVLVSAVGQLSRPAVPRLPGLGSFEGPAFHTAEWRHDVDLTGRRVAVVGTGASALQVVPAVVEDTAHLTVFQRSAPYVVPKPDGSRTWLDEVLHPLERELVWRLTESFNRALVEDNRLKQVVEKVWRLQLRRQVPDPDLRARLEPDYPLGCKRLLFSSTWYPALSRDDVTLVTAGVDEVLPHGLRDTDGEVHDADVIVWGTGFAATEFLAPMTVRGRDGADLHDRWKGGAHAYLGLCVPDFPNLFCIYGPNTNLGGSSIVNMLEAGADVVVRIVRELEATGRRSAEVRPEVEQDFDEEVQRRLRDSVWAACDSWYREDDEGRISTNWPGLVEEYQRRCAGVTLDDFVVA